MPYQATVYRVMIASPSDVAEERQTVREVVNDWNAAHSLARGITLLPVGWETNAAPEMGGRPQSIINRRLLEQCDLLVGAFWTRIGTPTGVSVSGTVEEIDQHLAAGRPVMLYFSSIPVVPESIDREQYDNLQEFKKSCYQRGLVESYATRDEFWRKLTTQLALTVNQHEYFIGAPKEGAKPELTVVPVPFQNRGTEVPSPSEIIPRLSNEAKHLLLTAAKDQQAIVLKLRTMSGLIVKAAGRNYVEDNNPRSEALWEAAVYQLCDHGLLKEEGYKGEVYSVTHGGFQVADKLSHAEA